MAYFSFRRSSIQLFVFVSVLLNVCNVVVTIRGVTAASSSDESPPTQHATAAALGKWTELQDQFEKSIQILLGTDTRLIRVDATKHTANIQIEFCPSALPIAMNAILTYTNPTTTTTTTTTTTQSPLLNSDPTISTDPSKELEMKVLASAMEICILCITNNPTNRAIFSDGQNIEVTTTHNTYTIHASIVSLLRVPELAAKAGHLIWIATYSNSKNHFHFIQANVIDQLSEVILSVPYPIPSPSDATTTPLALTVMWASAALQNLAASYCDNEDGGTCGWEWFQHTHEEGNVVVQYDFELTEESGTVVVDATEVRQAIASNTALVLRLLQWTCHGPVSGSMTIDNPFPGVNAMSIPEHESSMNIVPWAALGAISNIAIDLGVKRQLLEDYGDTMPCFCFMSTSPDWLEAVKGQYVIQHLRHDKDPCWFDFHESESSDVADHILCVDRLFTDINGHTCGEYNDPDKLTEEDCATPDIDNETILASTSCCLCDGGDHYPNRSPVNLHEPDDEESVHEDGEGIAAAATEEENMDYDEEEEDGEADGQEEL